MVLRQVGMDSLSPQHTNLVFDEWWENANLATSRISKRGLSSLIILGAWTIWNHRNMCVLMVSIPTCFYTNLVWRRVVTFDDGGCMRVVPPDGPPLGNLSLVCLGLCFVFF
jgi:hypothetical protein